MGQQVLAHLKEGQKAVIDSFTDDYTALKCMELGCLPGQQILMERPAPGGDPLAFSFGGILLGLRRREAEGILVHLISS